VGATLGSTISAAWVASFFFFDTLIAPKTAKIIMRIMMIIAIKRYIRE
jgi:hypothetical protein